MQCEPVGGGGAGSGSTVYPLKIEDSICSEPHLEMDTKEPKTVPIQESRQT